MHLVVKPKGKSMSQENPLTVKKSPLYCYYIAAWVFLLHSASIALQLPNIIT